MLLFLESKVVPFFAIVFTMAYLSAAIYCYNDYWISHLLHSIFLDDK